MKVTVFGNDCLIGKDSPEDQLYLFFPAESQINAYFLSENNLFRESTANKDKTKKGFFEATGRVKAIKFRGIISTGFVIPVSSLDACDELFWSDDLKVGDEFNEFDGDVLCKKYKIIRMQPTSTKESRFNKKLKRFDKLVPNQFRFHQSTEQLAKNIHHFHPNDIIVISDKWHGTSAVYANVLIKKKLSLLERVAKFLGVEVVTTKYDNLYSSRSVIKNQYINEGATDGGYYNEDIWGIVEKEVKEKVEPGITLYGEIVGYLPSGRAIQHGYDYGCVPQEEQLSKAYKEKQEPHQLDSDHKFVVYRITYTKPDGNVIEFTWNQIKLYCKKYSLETVKEEFHGTVHQYLNGNYTEATFGDMLITETAITYLEGDCKYCKNKVPREGVCVRLDGMEDYRTYKLKSKRFLERETKELDKGEVNIEDEQAA